MSIGRTMAECGPFPSYFWNKFWGKVSKTDTCWEWKGATRQGYGRIIFKWKRLRAHVIAYLAVVGPIPPGLQLDHLCRNRACVNPAHLEPVTSRVNTLRGNSWAGLHARATECVHGHPFDKTNTRVWNGHRICNQCQQAQNRRTAQRRSPAFWRAYRASRRAEGRPLP